MLCKQLFLNILFSLLFVCISHSICMRRIKKKCEVEKLTTDMSTLDAQGLNVFASLAKGGNVTVSGLTVTGNLNVAGSSALNNGVTTKTIDCTNGIKAGDINCLNGLTVKDINCSAGLAVKDINSSNLITVKNLNCTENFSAPHMIANRDGTTANNLKSNSIKVNDKNVLRDFSTVRVRHWRNNKYWDWNNTWRDANLSDTKTNTYYKFELQEFN